MPRPPKDPSDLKNVDVRIPLTADQKKIISDAAEAEGSDVATWARPILLRSAQDRLSKREKGRGK